MSAVALKAKILEARKTWLLVICIMAATIGIATVILILVHRRNKRRNQREKVSMNNNTDGKELTSPEEQEVL